MELHLSQFQLTQPLDKYLFWSIDHNLGNGLIIEQCLQRPQSQHLITDISHDLGPFSARNRKRVIVDNLLAVAVNNMLNLTAILIQRRQNLLFLRRHFIDDALMNTLFDTLIGGLFYFVTILFL